MSRYNGSSDLSPVLYAIIFILAMAFGCGRGALVRNNDSAVHTLETQGYTEIQVIDRSWYAIGWRGCDQNDAVRFTVVAKNPVGNKVTVYVCSGLLKGGTIRIP